MNIISIRLKIISKYICLKLMLSWPVTCRVYVNVNKFSAKKISQVVCINNHAIIWITAPQTSMFRMLQQIEVECQ